MAKRSVQIENGKKKRNLLFKYKHNNNSSKPIESTFQDFQFECDHTDHSPLAQVVLVVKQIQDKLFEHGCPKMTLEGLGSCQRGQRRL